MKHKKTLVALILCIVLVFSLFILVACDQNTGSNLGNNNHNQNTDGDLDNDRNQHKVHSFGEWQTITQPTCTNTGTKIRICTACGSEDHGLIPAEGHIMGEWNTVSEATCQDVGIEERICTHCDYKESALIAKRGHNYNQYEQCEFCNIGLKYQYDEASDSYSIMGYDGNKSEIIIPEIYNNKAVTRINEFAFYYKTELTSIVIPSSVTFIGKRSFEGCTGLTNLTIPFIGTTQNTPFAFGHLFTAQNSYIPVNQYVPANLRKIVITNATSIIANTFSECIGVNEIIIYEGITEIKDNTFSGCTNLETISLPNSVTAIGNKSFYNCGKLKKVTIPTGTTSIGNQVFVGCTMLENLTVDQGNVKYHSAGNCIIDMENQTIVAGCNNSVIPSIASVTTIGNGAFAYLIFSSITIPKNITVIKNSAFSNCTMLETINYEGTKDEWDAITKDSLWAIKDSTWTPESLHFTVHCSDEDIIY